MARVKLGTGGKFRPADDGYEVPKQDFMEACKKNFVGCKLLGVVTDEQGRRRWIYDIGHVKTRPVLDEHGEFVQKRIHTAVGCNMGGHDSQIQPACWYNLDKLETDHPGVGQIKKRRKRTRIDIPSNRDIELDAELKRLKRLVRVKRSRNGRVKVRRRVRIG